MMNDLLWKRVVEERSDPARREYAQWLKQNGENERSRFIIIQLQIAHLLRSHDVGAWLATVPEEQDSRALLRAHLTRWQQEEHHTTTFHWKGFPARVEIRTLDADTLGRLRSSPVEHVVLREPVSTAVFDHLLDARVRALTLQTDEDIVVTRRPKNRVVSQQLFPALLEHPLIHQLVWLRTMAPELGAAHWDALERVAPKRLLFVDARSAVSIEESVLIDDPGALDYTGSGCLVSVRTEDLRRPVWRCPQTTWGPIPTLTRVLSCAAAIEAGLAETPTPGALQRVVSHWSDIVLPGIDFSNQVDADQVGADRGWDPEREW